MSRPLTALLFAGGLLAASAAHAHRGHTHEAAWIACDDKALGAECAWLDRAHARYVGTCRAIGARHICVRNRPIEPPPTAWHRLWHLLPGVDPAR